MRACCAAPKCRDNDVANCDEFGLALVLSFTTAQIINRTWLLIFNGFLNPGHVSLLHHRLDDVARRVNARQSRHVRDDEDIGLVGACFVADSRVEYG